MLMKKLIHNKLFLSSFVADLISVGLLGYTIHTGSKPIKSLVNT